MHSFLFFLCFSTFLVANEQIESLFEIDSYEKACVLSDELYSQNPYSFKSNLYYARCAKHRGELDKAVAAYDRADILKEKSVEVHKGLGDLYVQLGNIEIANMEYDKADSFGNTPVKRVEDKNHNPHKFSILLSLSSGYDSNVNYNAELVDMADWLGSLPSPDDKPSSDMYTKEYLRFTHVYKANPFTSLYYKTQVHIYNKNYFDLHEEDFFQSDIKTGFGFSSQKFDLWLPISYKYIAIAYDTYADTYSFNPRFRYRLENKILLSCNLKYEQQKYKLFKGSDKDSYSVHTSASRWFGKNYFRFSYDYLIAKKKDSTTPNIFVDKNLNEIKINYTRKFMKKLEFGVSALYRKTEYKDLVRQDTSIRREDDLSIYSAYISYNFNKSLILNTKYTRHNNDTSYIPLLYKKDVVNVGVYYYY